MSYHHLRKVYAAIALKVGTSYECARRLSTEMFEVGLPLRIKVETGKKGRPNQL